MSNAIVTENALPGSSGWKFSNFSTTQIQVYADKTSLDPGQSINFYVSTQVAGTTYTIRIYRLGWYSGLGGCLKFTSATQTGTAQGYYDGSAIQNSSTTIYDATTHLVDAGWTSSYTWLVPGGSCTGVYIALFTDANGFQTSTNFVVRGTGTEDYAVIRGYSTDAAYNQWGAWSLYTSTKAYKVSLNRPGWGNGGSSNLYAYDLSAIRWLEQQGYDLGYLSCIDLHTTPNTLQGHKAYLSLGHDEYWTKEMRTAVENARDSGLGLGFLGADACYWQCRLEADVNSNANRTVTCYKVATSGGPALSTDPLYGTDNSRVTALWRDLFLNRPENVLLGIMFSDDYQPNNYPWVVDAQAASHYLANTNLTPGQSYGFDLVGYEWDNKQSGGPTNLQVIGTSPVTGVNGVGTANTTYYTANSGALVFAAGSLSFMWAMDSYRQYPTGTPIPIPGMQQLMVNIMADLIRPRSQAATAYNVFGVSHT